MLDETTNAELTEAAKWILNEHKDKLPKLLQDVMHQCSSMIRYCLWQGKPVPCASVDSFKIRPTDAGYCCSFNTLTMQEQFVADTAIHGLAHLTNEFDDYDNDEDYGDYIYSGSSTSPRTSTVWYTTWSYNATALASPATISSVPVSQKKQSLSKKAALKDTNDNEKELTNKNNTNVKEPTKLKRSNIANSMLGLTVFLDPSIMEYSESSLNSFYGFQVLVHNPYDFAEVSGKGFAIGVNHEAFIAVGAHVTESSPAVEKMNHDRRGCMRHREDHDILREHGVTLEAFKTYSEKACILECRAREMFKKCGCLPYYFPSFRKIWRKKTSCDLKGLRCLASIHDEVNALNPNDDAENGKVEPTLVVKGLRCNCPADCMEILYIQELSQSSMRPQNRLVKKLERPGQILHAWNQALVKLEAKLNMTVEARKIMRIQQSIDNIRAKREYLYNSSSVVHIFFKELGVVKYTRDEIYSVMDLIASFGGIVGLCMGVSLLSGVEIFYWFTIRIFFNNYQWRKISF